MLFMTRTDDAATRFPWEEGHACPEDRALGLELELIELVHALEDADPVTAVHLDRQIETAMTDLAHEATVAARTWPGPAPTD